jgi:cytoskeletal protein CcmA (bactofilin family)
MAKQTENSSNAVNIIALSTKIHGEINTDSDIRIDGTLEGNLKTSGRLIIGAQGKVNGEVICRVAEIEGNLTGKIEVKDLLTLKEKSNLQGEVTTGQLMIEPGAIFSGNCKMNSKADIKTK